MSVTPVGQSQSAPIGSCAFGICGQTVSETLKIGMGKVAQPVRVAVTGTTVSPGIGDTLELIGKEEALMRIDAALKFKAP